MHQMSEAPFLHYFIDDENFLEEKELDICGFDVFPILPLGMSKNPYILVGGVKSYEPPLTPPTSFYRPRTITTTTAYMDIYVYVGIPYVHPQNIRPYTIGILMY